MGTKVGSYRKRRTTISPYVPRMRKIRHIKMGRNKVKDIFSLLDVIHEAFSRPEYTPGNGITHCNAFTSEVVSAMGFKAMEGLLANSIVDLLSRSDQWSEVDLTKVQDLSNAGTLVVLGAHGEPHGHVCIGCPGKSKFSGRWGQVPTVASVGAQNMIRGVNWVFSDMPRCWAYRPTL